MRQSTTHYQKQNPCKRIAESISKSPLPAIVCALLIIPRPGWGQVVVVTAEANKNVQNSSSTTDRSSSNNSTRVGTTPQGSSYKPVGPGDDEVHDDEIMEAVRNSLRLWQEGKLNKTHYHSRNRVKRDEEVVCYGVELGCFRDEGPFDYLDMLPSPPEEIGTHFLFYSKESEPEVFSFFNYSKISTSPNAVNSWNASKETKVIIHGFGSTCKRIWASEMRLALMSVVDCNVICVDWENGAALPNYVRAAVNTRLVGKQLSLLLRKLVSEAPGVTSYQSFHLIGFSLGAQVAGFTGQELRNISRITGLDPAGPLFENYDKRVRLDATDAVFVDVIHSNGDSLLMGGLGSWEPVGHLDFYPNGGRVQKGCSNLFLGAFRDFIWSSPTKETSTTSNGDGRNGKSLSTSEHDGRSLCNHRRAYRFFTESVSPRCPYPAFSCESYDKFLSGGCFQWDNNMVHSAHMGFYADRHQTNPRVARQLSSNSPQPVPQQSSGKSGGKNFYLVTRDDEPFCANQYKIVLESSPPLGVPISTYGGVEAMVVNANDDFNETFLVTETHKDNMISGSVLQKLVVAHPAVTDPVKVVLKYTAYKGWIYSGISRWSLDRLIITNSFGHSYSFCARGLLLPSGISVTVSLTKGVCSMSNFPFRYPHVHSFPPPPSSSHGHSNNMIHPHIFRNEINETSSSSDLAVSAGGSSSSDTKSTRIPEREYMDWSNDWHPIIVNTTASPITEAAGARCDNGEDDCTSHNGKANATEPTPSSSTPSTQTSEGDQLNNEIDDGGSLGERRSSRQLNSVHLVPLSRAIEPRPVVFLAPRGPIVQRSLEDDLGLRRRPLLSHILGTDELSPM